MNIPFIRLLKKTFPTCLALPFIQTDPVNSIQNFIKATSYGHIKQMDAICIGRKRSQREGRRGDTTSKGCLDLCCPIAKEMITFTWRAREIKKERDRGEERGERGFASAAIIFQVFTYSFINWFDKSNAIQMRETLKICHKLKWTNSERKYMFNTLGLKAYDQWKAR